MTVALPLSAGSTRMLLLHFNSFKLRSSAAGKFNLGIFERRSTRTISCLMLSALSGGRRRIAASAPVMMSSNGKYLGAIAKFNPFERTETVSWAKFFSVKLCTALGRSACGFSCLNAKFSNLRFCLRVVSLRVLTDELLVILSTMSQYSRLSFPEISK